jgi:hypothetical protein
LTAPVQSYAGFNEGVSCKSPSTNPLSFGDRVCDSVTPNVPQRVRICNKASCLPGSDGMYTYLPRTREVGWVDVLTINTYKALTSSEYYLYVPNTNFALNTLVKEGDAFYRVGPFKQALSGNQ